MAATVWACGEAVAPIWETPPADDTSIPIARRETYLRDAEHLAARYALLTGDAGVEVPRVLVRDLYQRLVLVDNARAVPARDSVVTLYGIHAFPAPATRQVLVFPRQDADWAGPWMTGARFTGNPDIDGLLVSLDLTPTRCVVLHLADYDMCRLESSRPLMINAVARLFEVIPGVHHAGPNSAVGSGNDIRATRDSAAWRLDYSVGYGDCPSGCIVRRYWHYAVTDDGRVAYLGSDGGPPPQPGER